MFFYWIQFFYSTYLKRPTSAVGKAEEVKSNASEDKYVEKTLEEVIYGDDEEENIIDIWDQPDNPILWQKTAHTTMKQVSLHHSEPQFFNSLDLLLVDGGHYGEYIIGRFVGRWMMRGFSWI